MTCRRMARKGTFLFPLHWAEAVEAFNRITRPSAAAVMLANHLKELNSFSLSLFESFEWFRRSLFTFSLGLKWEDYEESVSTIEYFVVIATETP